MAKERPILIGYMALEGWADDYSEWDGVITGPSDPKGANRFWENPIEMIEKRAFNLTFDTLGGLQGAVAALMEANEEGIECRGDEDCDHCHCLALMAEVDKYLKENTAARAQD